MSLWRTKKTIQITADMNRKLTYLSVYWGVSHAEAMRRTLKIGMSVVDERKNEFQQGTPCRFHMHKEEKQRRRNI